MKRVDFIKEMCTSLLQTVKNVYEPFVQEDLEKVEEVADRALGITWVPLLMKEDESFTLEMKFMVGKPVVVSHFNSNIQAFVGICPECSNIISVTALYSSGKCLNCGKQYNFMTHEGDLLLEDLPLKLKNQIYFVGFQMNMKQGASHA